MNSAKTWKKQNVRPSVLFILASIIVFSWATATALCSSIFMAKELESWPEEKHDASAAGRVSKDFL